MSEVSIICNNGPQHRHDSVLKSKICWGVITPEVYKTPTPAPAVVAERMASPAQLRYVQDLGGDIAYASSLTGGRNGTCSKYIESLIAGRKHPVSRPTEFVPTVPAPKVEDPRISLIKGMMPALPSGYFAVRGDDTEAFVFIRISRPKNGKFRGATKVQTIHAENLTDKAVLWPSGAMSVYRENILDSLMLLVVGHRQAARDYATEINRCMKCNTRLTDPKSRHYGIGPICDKQWTWVIEEVDEEHDGQSFETLHHLGVI